ncbi:hypothetical protein KKD80_02935 [Patescibacteria group bacterium]|nr:hypothetical protein [Patescibacteria group bacterium]
METKKQSSLKLEIIEKISVLATASLGLVAALAWNEAILELFKYIFGEQGTLAAKFLYALIVTLLVVYITIKLGHVINKLKERIGEK